MTSDQTILITGVTGNQGGAVAQALQGTGFYLRGLTRKPDSERAAALARHGVDIVKGDLDDEASLRRILEKAGYAGVCPWDWRQVEHADVDDFSQAYFPHMDKERGVLVNLNMQGVKR